MKNSPTKIKASGSDLTKLLVPYASGWVALSADEQRVVGAGETLQEAHDKAIAQYEPDPIYIKVIPPSEGYLPFTL